MINEDPFFFSGVPKIYETSAPLNKVKVPHSTHTV